jgi:hypothetical protein
LTNKFSPFVAAAALVAIAPAALFMAALVARQLPQTALASPAEGLVAWYSARMWTLWLLLLAMPCVALVTGGAALAQAWRPRFAFVVTTLLSAVFLAIVVLHMAAN